eukprot:CAMPEP_0202690712 /NCGR_PEP_ID=MMETSP1385-20130828/5623_1 /ASSEMBLY_ACC=CAM_ASM_000861 /TAXON_ID=933848 /ORGANISM="Elphidium margaritaceum" /LENGTH=98 /DNA_ID=CAMNT_0049346003 /DNA_START=89 /DNA_END=382 /DNA_ORIENTATION=+
MTGNASLWNWYFAITISSLLLIWRPAHVHAASSPCQGKYGGDWSLVRHAYNTWHPATDNLAGTHVYGTFDDDPQSEASWSRYFITSLPSDRSMLFMFS